MRRCWPGSFLPHKSFRLVDWNRTLTVTITLAVALKWRALEFILVIPIGSESVLQWSSPFTAQFRVISQKHVKLLMKMQSKIVKIKSQPPSSITLWPHVLQVEPLIIENPFSDDSDDSESDTFLLSEDNDDSRSVSLDDEQLDLVSCTLLNLYNCMFSL